MRPSTPTSLPPRQRLLLGAAALLIAGGCAEGAAPTGSDALQARVARIALTAHVAPQTTSLTTVTQYYRASTTSGYTSPYVTIDSQTVALDTAATSSIPLRINMSQCLADSTRETPEGMSVRQADQQQLCVLHLFFAAQDASGTVLGRAFAVVNARVGAVEDTPPIYLGTAPAQRAPDAPSGPP